MRFGWGLWADRPVDELVELCRLAESLGFEDVWFNDHYFLRCVYIVEALAARKTASIRLGTSITSPYLRHPALLASAVATLNEVSHGRAILGLGSGGYEYESNLGTPIPRPLSACREAIDIIRALWTGEEVSAGGPAFHVERARLVAGGTNAIPIYLGARGRRMLTLAGETCEGVIMHGPTLGHCEFVRDAVTQGARSAGRTPKSVDIGCLTEVVVTTDVESTVKRLRARCLDMAGGEYSLESADHYGLSREDVVPLRAALRRGDRDTAISLVTPEMVNAFCIVGPPDTCLERLHALEAAGLNHLMASAGPGRDTNYIVQSMNDLAEHVMEPYLRVQ